MIVTMTITKTVSATTTTTVMTIPTIKLVLPLEVGLGSLLVGIFTPATPVPVTTSEVSSPLSFGEVVNGGLSVGLCEP